LYHSICEGIDRECTGTESQRDSETEPRVARHELPWVNGQGATQPQRGCDFVFSTKDRRPFLRYLKVIAKTRFERFGAKPRSNVMDNKFRIETQPRWGWTLGLAVSQGSSSLATAGLWGQIPLGFFRGLRRCSFDFQHPDVFGPFSFSIQLDKKEGQNYDFTVISNIPSILNVA
jgi:hypothetical protein